MHHRSSAPLPPKSAPPFPPRAPLAQLPPPS
jgi:hypothetical protein